MNPTDSRAEAILQAALALSGHAEREALIGAECGEYLALEMRVRRLLREHEDAGGSPEDALLSPEIEAEMARLKPEDEGERIADYKLREQVGEGRFGTVWVADQEQPVRRRVALKIIKLGMGAFRAGLGGCRQLLFSLGEKTHCIAAYRVGPGGIFSNYRSARLQRMPGPSSKHNAYAYAERIRERLPGRLQRMLWGELGFHP